MAVEGVMVSYSKSDRSGKIEEIVTSGLKFSEKWVLGHGFLLAPLEIGKIISETENYELSISYESIPDVTVTCEVGDRNLERGEIPPSGNIAIDKSYQVKIVKGRVRHVWRCPVLSKWLEKLMRSWTIGLKFGCATQQTHIAKELCSVFVLIDLQPDGSDFHNPSEDLLKLFQMVRPAPRRGEFLEIHSTPLGCEAFLNSVTKGIVCSEVGDKSLLLTDAATAMGSEGGPVFSSSDRGLVGVVLSSVAWCRGEWVGLTLVAPLATVLSTKLNTPLPSTISYKKDVFSDIVDDTMLVRCGAVWGSGLYLGQNYILTCAHVVSGHLANPITVYCRGTREIAQVVYKTENGRAYDLALLLAKSDPWKLKPALFADGVATKGEPVLAVGYPYFNESDIKAIRPTLTSGHISNVSPTMILTSCCIQSGFSGGPIYIMRSEVPQVIGIIVCNAKTSNGVAFPYINMAVPVKAFKDNLKNIIFTKGLSDPKVLEIDNEIVQAQWRLVPYKSKI